MRKRITIVILIILLALICIAATTIATTEQPGGFRGHGATVRW